ncbi:hypothetical protein [Nostoc sp.]
MPFIYKSCIQPVTDELAIRGYHQEWKRLMKANFKLTAQAVEHD